MQILVNLNIALSTNVGNSPTLLHHTTPPVESLVVQDNTGIAHLPGGSSQFLPDRRTPSPVLCTIFDAWGQLLSAAEGAVEGSAPNGLDLTKEPFRYDLVNLGRELLAQLATPLSMNFSDAIKPGNAKPDAAAIRSTGYVSHHCLSVVPWY